MKKTRAALMGILAAAVTLPLAVPAHADPQAVAEAKAELERIQQEASAIDQQIIEAAVRAQEAEQKLEQVTEDLEVQQEKVSGMADDLAEIAMLQFRSGGMDWTAQLLTSDSEDNFLSSLATLQNEADRSNAGIQQLQVEQAELDALRAEADRTHAALEADRQAKEDLADEFDAKEAEAEQVYKRLDAEEKERLRQLELQRQREQEEADRRAREAEEAARRDAQARTSRSEERQSAPASRAASSSSSHAQAAEPAPAPASGRAAQAVQHALAQVGKRYVWGTSGPNTFDCSGLTSYAYRQVGISLPRSSRAQLGMGRSVSKSQLQPGDLVFYYSPVSHVGMYIGNGKIVHAANPRTGVNITSLNSMPFAGARRVG